MKFVTLGLAVISFVAFVIYLVCLIALHFLPTGYNPLFNTISDYSVGRFNRLARISTAVNAVGVLLLLGAFVTLIGSPPVPWSGLMWLVILALSRFGMVIFTTDVSGQKITPRGIVHIILAVISFIAGISALSTITRALGTLSDWSSVYPFFKLLAQVAFPILIAVVVTFLIPSLRKIFGLVERLFLLTIHLWLLVASGVLVANTVGLFH